MAKDRVLSRKMGNPGINSQSGSSFGNREIGVRMKEFRHSPDEALRIKIIEKLLT